MCSSGRPQTGRMRTRVPTISVTAGASRSSAGVFSRAQPSRRRAGAVELGARQDGDGVDLVALDDVGHLVQVAEDGQAVEGVRAAIGLFRRQAAADDAVAVVGLAIDLLVERGDGAAVADEQGRLQ